MNKTKQELKNLSPDELHKKIESMHRELFRLRLNAASAHVKDYSRFKKLRRNLARALTFLREKTT